MSFKTERNIEKLNLSLSLAGAENQIQFSAFPFFNKIKMSDDNKKRISTRSFKEKEKINGFLELLFCPYILPRLISLSLSHTHAHTHSLSFYHTHKCTKPTRERMCVCVKYSIVEQVELRKAELQRLEFTTERKKLRRLWKKSKSRYE